ncbi:MAG: bifunctional DNA-formamidopyrimidine glycosylase/DNA-(apurinic or apyrimidinic site) lyase [Candidatus Omnitrophica bacterium]|nr:bifunctional DNA-formamidopyrimidine glycosylase/DNA-(apurinic or apyrimidinic site) lyase [Candidatus Omnitrophota bacterium]MBU1871275.1 bifunctional DNA-formamidopyrimidine glycosylase/DNA-(apurinic or apyrimidinic site) lyase [Candidatus Omnitrophota bacterium]
MPELPEVETIKRELEKTVLGKKITGVKINNSKVIKQPGTASFVKNIKNARINNILRKGKLLILELSSGKSLAVHLRMTGQLVYPGDCKRSRVSFKLSGNKWLDFNDSRLLGELRLLGDWRQLKFVKNLGPEPFDLTLDEFKHMLAGRKTKIKPLLMDQTFISGVGNLYAAEALFRAKIHPGRPARSLSGKDKARLFRAVIVVLREAIKYKGSSLDQYVQLSNKPGDYVKYHKVYARAGKPCLICKTPVKRTTLGGRGTYFCPQCQK